MNARSEVSSLTQILLSNTAFAEAISELWNGKPISVDGVIGSSCALAAAAIVQADGNFKHEPVLFIVPKSEMERVADDLELFTDAKILAFPAMEKIPLPEEEDDNVFALADDLFGQRINVLKNLSKRSEHPSTQEKIIIVTSIDSLSQSVPTREILAERTQTLAVGNRVDLDKLRRFLVEGGYHNTSAVDLPGEFAVRGYIFDLFAPDWEQPVRLEFFDDEIESIRRFDLTTQRSLENVTEINLTRLLPSEAVGATLLDYLSQKSPILLLEPREIELAAQKILTNVLS